MSDIAWAAGLFEGEGSFYMDDKGRPGRAYPRLQLAMGDADVVERFRAVVGYGTIRVRARQQEGWSTMYEWAVRDARGVIAVTLMLLPWLGARRSAKAEQILDAAAVIGLPNGVRTHCPQGHAYTGDNLAWEFSKGSHSRRCRECNRAKARERYARKQATAAPGERRGA